MGIAILNAENTIKINGTKISRNFAIGWESILFSIVTRNNIPLDGY